MAETKGEERLRTLEEGLSIARVRIDTLSKSAEEAAGDLKALAVLDPKQVVADLQALRQEIAVLKQRLDDHLKRVEVWEGRRWGLVMLLIGAVLSLASGLIVTLARK